MFLKGSSKLANERTYLAWLRTALAFVASGVAAAWLLAGQTLHWAWEVAGVLLNRHADRLAGWERPTPKRLGSSDLIEVGRYTTDG